MEEEEEEAEEEVVVAGEGEGEGEGVMEEGEVGVALSAAKQSMGGSPREVASGASTPPDAATKPHVLDRRRERRVGSPRVKAVMGGGEGGREAAAEVYDRELPSTATPRRLSSVAAAGPTPPPQANPSALALQAGTEEVRVEVGVQVAALLVLLLVLVLALAPPPPQYQLPLALPVPVPFPEELVP